LNASATFAAVTASFITIFSRAKAVNDDGARALIQACLPSILIPMLLSASATFHAACAFYMIAFSLANDDKADGTPASMQAFEKIMSVKN